MDGDLPPFYLVCIVVGLVVEQRWGTDRQIILQWLAQQRVTPITYKIGSKYRQASKEITGRTHPCAVPTLFPYIVLGPWAGGTV